MRAATEDRLCCLNVERRERKSRSGTRAVTKHFTVSSANAASHRERAVKTAFSLQGRADIRGNSEVALSGPSSSNQLEWKSFGSRLRLKNIDTTSSKKARDAEKPTLIADDLHRQETRARADPAEGPISPLHLAECHK